MNNISRKVVKNATWIIACKIVQAFISLVIGTVSARYLGPSNYGLISYASSVVAFVLPLAQLGLRNVLVEQIISYPEMEGEILGTSLVMGMVSSLFSIFGCIGFVWLVNAGERDTLFVCALYSISLFFQMLEMVEYWYQAKLLSKYTSLVSLAAYVIVALYRVSLLVMQKSIYWFALTNVMDYGLISVALLLMYHRLGTQRISFSFRLVKELFSVSRYYIISSMMVTIFSQTDKIMIKMMIGNVENGYYSTAVTCASMSGFVFTAIIDSMRPIILESKKKSQTLFNRNMSRLYSVIIYFGLVQSMVLTLLAKQVVLFLYGETYRASVEILKIVTWYLAFSYMGSVRNIWILAENEQKHLWKINLSGAILNVVGNYILIPKFGACGAAIASVATQFFTNFILCLIIRPIKPTAILIWKALNPKLILEMIPQKETSKHE